MAIKSTLLHYESYSSIANLRFSANAANTKYTIGPDGAEVYDVTPSTPVDIPYDKLVFIKDVAMDWTHGKARKFYSIDDMEEALQEAVEDALTETKEYVDDKINTYVPSVDNKLDSRSTNPVQNKIVTAEINNARSYTDQKVAQMVSSMGVIDEISIADYLLMRNEGTLQNKFYTIYKNGQLYRVFLGDQLFARKADEGEHATAGSIFPLILPIIFA